MQSPVVREHAGIADDRVIMKAVALGWPDDSFPANAVSERKSVAEAARFIGLPAIKIALAKKPARNCPLPVKADCATVCDKYITRSEIEQGDEHDNNGA